MARRYRRRPGRFNDWHFHPECPDWPEADYIEPTDPPPPQEICRRCQELVEEPDTNGGVTGVTLYILAQIDYHAVGSVAQLFIVA